MRLFIVSYTNYFQNMQGHNVYSNSTPEDNQLISAVSFGAPKTSSVLPSSWLQITGHSTTALASTVNHHESRWSVTTLDGVRRTQEILLSTRVGLLSIISVVSRVTQPPANLLKIVSCFPKTLETLLSLDDIAKVLLTSTILGVVTEDDISCVILLCCNLRCGDTKYFTDTKYLPIQLPPIPSMTDNLADTGT